MILRYSSSRAALRLRQWQQQHDARHAADPLLPRLLARPFHASQTLHDDPEGLLNHYETLNVPLDASPAEIKKSFYTLSKTHHPDHNPDDPTAPRRFMRISEAYAVLNVPDRRTAYDRDVLHRPHAHHHLHHHHHHHPQQRGSYSSTGPAGGRPASGLSRRRGTFTGPPPSFFGSGGWGAQGAKRAASHADSTGSSASPSGTAGSGTMGGMGPGQDPFGHRNEDVPHFDREAHERTQRRVDERRARRMAGLADDAGGPVAPAAGVAGGFLGICGILALSVLVPYLIMGGWRRPRSSGEEKKGAAQKKAKKA